MNSFDESMIVMNELFGKDYQFALATTINDMPSIRFVDAFFDKGSFYIVTYDNTQKIKEINTNKNVSLCNEMYNFSGIAKNIGHPLDKKNHEIRKKLVKVFEPWYFIHNDESDEKMCYIEIKVTHGFCYKDGIGYKMDFINKKAKKISFECDIVFVK